MSERAIQGVMDSRYLATALEHEWSDVLFPGNEEFLSEGVFFADVAEFLAKHLKRPPRQVCEIGAGCGRFAWDFHYYFSSTERYLLTDASPEKIGWAKWIMTGEPERTEIPVIASQTKVQMRPAPESPRLRCPVEFLVARAGDPAIPREEFDLVICLNVVDHVPDPGKFINGMLKELLVPGGTMLLASVLDWHRELTPEAMWRDDLKQFLDNGWRVGAESNHSFPWRSRPRRLIWFKSQVILATKLNQ